MAEEVAPSTPKEEKNPPVSPIAVKEETSAAGEATKASPKIEEPASTSVPKKVVSPATTKATAVAKPKAAHSLEDARKEVTKLITSSKITNQDCSAIRAILKEHATLKEKVDKLKSLLGRSAKAQRETKVDFEASQKRLAQALREIERLSQRLDKLQSRPSHCKFEVTVSPSFCIELCGINQYQYYQL